MSFAMISCKELAKQLDPSNADPDKLWTHIAARIESLSKKTKYSREEVEALVDLILNAPEPQGRFISEKSLTSAHSSAWKWQAHSSGLDIAEVRMALVLRSVLFSEMNEEKITEIGVAFGLMHRYPTARLIMLRHAFVERLAEYGKTHKFTRKFWNELPGYIFQTGSHNINAQGEGGLGDERQLHMVQSYQFEIILFQVMKEWVKDSKNPNHIDAIQYIITYANDLLQTRNNPPPSEPELSHLTLSRPVVESLQAYSNLPPTQQDNRTLSSIKSVCKAWGIDLNQIKEIGK